LPRAIVVFWALENAAIRIFLPWIWLCAAWGLFPWAQEAQAQVPPGAAGQTPAPITVTPRSLSPAQRSDGTAVDLPASGGLIAPPGADRVSVMIGSVVVDGGFPGMDAARQAAFTPLVGRKTTLDALYDAASALETAYARAGYVLVRVAVPPQDLVPGGPFRVVVVDGFIEAADLSALPRAVRGPVAASLAPVLRRHRLRMADIEQALLLAGDTPGLALRSALARGTEPGGTRLVIDGTFDRQSATLGARNDYAPQLGTYGFSAEATLNSPLGMGEAFYGYLAGGKDLERTSGRKRGARRRGPGCGRRARDRVPAALSGRGLRSRRRGLRVSGCGRIRRDDGRGVRGGASHRSRFHARREASRLGGATHRGRSGVSSRSPSIRKRDPASFAERHRIHAFAGMKAG